MTRVDYFEVEVRYNGAFEEYALEDWIEKAKAEADRGDPFYESRLEDDGFAKVIDGKYYVENRFPCNKIAVVQWAEIREEEAEDDD